LLIPCITLVEYSFAGSLRYSINGLEPSTTGTLAVVPPLINALHPFYFIKSS
jgi:hypothetical protein